MANPGWSSLIVPEAEGFDLVMPTWVVDRIIADHEQAVWAREVAKPALEQTGLDVARAALASFPQ